MTKTVRFTAEDGKGYEVRFEPIGAGITHIGLYDLAGQPVYGWNDYFTSMDSKSIKEKSGHPYEDFAVLEAKQYVNLDTPVKLRNLHAKSADKP